MHEDWMWDIAEAAAAQIGASHFGFVQSYNPNNHTAKVLVYHGPDTTTLTDDLPIEMGGYRYAPTVGQMAFMNPDSHDAQALVISGFCYSDQNQPPRTKTAIGGAPSLLQPGEFEIVGPGGSTLRFVTDGSGYCTFPKGLGIEADVSIRGDVDITGSASTTGNMSAGTGWTGTFTDITGRIFTVMDGIIVNGT